jgi:hypothetical protein
MNLHHLLYLDPGNGAMLAQVLAGIAGTYYVTKNYVIKFFKKRKSPVNEFE